LGHVSYHPTTVRIRPATEDDLLSLAHIFVRTVTDLDARFRPDHPAIPIEPESRLVVYRHLLRTGALFVADDPDPAGFSAAILRDGVWFLSQLWVLPERQGEGIGAALLDEALAWGSGAGAFTVVASPHPAAVTLYLRASMYPLWIQYELEDPGRAPIPEPPPGADPLRDDDQPWVDALDRQVRGAVRPEDHALFRGEATGLALRPDGRPRGYVYAWPGGKVGPGAVRDPADLPDLLRAARHAAGGPISVAVPSTNWTALRELLGLGLVPTTINTFLASRPLGDGARYLSSGGALG
jgi:GNAT superfamily N-acetyltransferase